MPAESPNQETNVSDLLLYVNCPRKVYFINRGYELFPEMNGQRLERMILKELSLTFPRELADVTREILEEGEARARAKIPEIAANLVGALEEYGKEPMLAALTPVKTEPFLSSKKLNLKGVPSKLVCFEGAQVPSILKPGSCPEQGVWASDRIHAAALAMLLEAGSEKEVPFSFVEYVSYGLSKFF